MHGGLGPAVLVARVLGRMNPYGGEGPLPRGASNKDRRSGGRQDALDESDDKPGKHSFSTRPGPFEGSCLPLHEEEMNGVVCCLCREVLEESGMLWQCAQCACTVHAHCVYLQGVNKKRRTGKKPKDLRCPDCGFVNKLRAWLLVEPPLAIPEGFASWREYFASLPWFARDPSMPVPSGFET